jgi:cytochrome c553
MLGRFVRCFIVWAGTLAAFAPAVQAAPSTGERIYREGVFPSGRPLQGERDAGLSVVGEAAACVSCHRRSGLGAWEGQSVVPPIIGAYLFRPGARNVDDPNLPHIQGYVRHRDAYTDATLARAIRKGIDQSGRKLSYLMPRYNLDDAAMAALIAHLKSLTPGDVPGVVGDVLHFATIVTPDADPVARKGMLDVLEQFFADKNAGYRGNAPPLQSRRGIMYRVNRRWQLHVWELSGPPESWDRQLRAKMAATPVFVVISGIGGRIWAPVHQFCEREQVPCLLPNVDLPVVAENNFYPVYYSRGVLLEADLMALPKAGLEPLRLRDSGRLVPEFDAGHAKVLDCDSREAGRNLQGDLVEVGNIGGCKKRAHSRSPALGGEAGERDRTARGHVRAVKRRVRVALPVQFGAYAGHRRAREREADSREGLAENAARR